MKSSENSEKLIKAERLAPRVGSDWSNTVRRCRLKMKGSKIIIIWSLLFFPLSVFNILGNPTFLPTSLTTLTDSRVLHYNFTMGSPIRVEGNFSVRVPLDKTAPNYSISANVNVSEAFESYGPYGSFLLIANLSDNGFYDVNHEGNFEGNLLSPPVPPSGYGTKSNGPLPFYGAPESFSHVGPGANTVGLNFTFLSQLSTYGTGYYTLDIGPFTVNVADLTTRFTIDIVSEVFLAGILIPVAHILARKLQR